MFSYAQPVTHPNSSRPLQRWCDDELPTAPLESILNNNACVHHFTPSSLFKRCSALKLPGLALCNRTHVCSWVFRGSSTEILYERTVFVAHFSTACCATDTLMTWGNTPKIKACLSVCHVTASGILSVIVGIGSPLTFSSWRYTNLYSVPITRVAHFTFNGVTFIYRPDEPPNGA